MSDPFNLNPNPNPNSSVEINSFQEIPSHIPNLAGFTYGFEDGTRLDILQIKVGGEDYRVHYTVTASQGALPRKLVLPLKDFIDRFGHLIRAKGIVV